MGVWYLVDPFADFYSESEVDSSSIIKMNVSTPFMFPPFETAKQPKSPKSPKPGLDNPLLKSSSTFFPAPSLIPELDRSPLLAIQNGHTTPLNGTPGPPPKASLSLNGNVNMDMKVKGSIVSKESSFHTPAKRPIPVPGASPQLIGNNYDENMHNVEQQSCDWVVAYGYTNERESKQLYSMLQGYGNILARKSKSNWIAVQYEDELSAARASARQLVRVGSALCGVSRTNLQMLQETIATAISDTVDPSMESSVGLLPPYEKSTSLEEQDILAATGGRRAGKSEGNESKSVCEMIFYWYFGWDPQEIKLHQD